MPSPIHVPLASRCVASTRAGSRCSCARVEGQDVCLFHDARRRKVGNQPADACVPSLNLRQLGELDLASPDGIAAARVGVWQHLLAGSLDPHVAKAALPVAESIHAAAPKRKAERSAVVDAVAEVLASKPPGQQDE